MPRAQTSLDFLVGTTVFLLTLSAVLATVPGLVDPFATGQESATITADRAAERLATDVLVDTPTEPYVFDAEAVDAFFQGGLTVDQAKRQLGIPTSTGLNVTLRSTSDFSIGNTPPSTADTSVAWRSGTYEGASAELVVKVW